MALSRGHEETVLDVASRRRLFECVEGNQGTHLRDLARRAAIPLGTALYHLDRLETSGLVVARRDGRYKRYFAGHSLGPEEKAMLAALRRAMPRRIVAALLDTGAITQRELCARIGVARSTLSFHVVQLQALGILRREDSRPDRHYLLQDAELAARLMTRYGASLGDVGPLAHPRASISIPHTLVRIDGPAPTQPVGGA